MYALYTHEDCIINKSYGINLSFLVYAEANPESSVC